MNGNHSGKVCRNVELSGAGERGIQFTHKQALGLQFCIATTALTDVFFESGVFGGFQIAINEGGNLFSFANWVDYRHGN
jgi:hypothetical protein